METASGWAATYPGWRTNLTGRSEYSRTIRGRQLLEIVTFLAYPIFHHGGHHVVIISFLVVYENNRYVLVLTGSGGRI